MRIQQVLALAGMMLAGLSGCSRARTIPLDQSTPEAAIHSTIRAISEHNSEQVRECFAVQTGDEKAYAQAMGHLVEAAATMEQKLRDRFGRDGARAVMGDGGPTEEDFNRFVQGSSRINGSEARVTDSLGHVLVLRSVGGAWKIVPDEPIQRQTDQMNAVASILMEVAAGVGDVNRFPEAQDVKGEVLRREEAILVGKGK